ncbi:hypothetical protein A4X13_0g7224 [Tilletia indica]|uniref:Uncharacterized protein n=1 Tax=Tilletia indica TaxID=43049 RepID=A0A177TG52_9BASI|nr:hypothetical protein A4X13_0g7224 [Tilletia indica]
MSVNHPEQQRHYYADIPTSEAAIPHAATVAVDTTEEMDPNFVTPWGQYDNPYAHTVHNHSQQHSSSYTPTGFHDIPQQRRPSVPDGASIEDDRAGLVSHPGGHPASNPSRHKMFKSSSQAGSLDLDAEKAMLKLHRQSRMGFSTSADGTETGPQGHKHNGSKDMQRDLSDFDIANGRSGKRLIKSKGHIQAHGDQLPITFGHLFKRPLVRQWLHNGKLYREEEEREPSRFELFFDLSFVGIVHLLAEGAAESATAMNVAKFVLTFSPAWSIWLDVRQFINISGTDDVFQRIYILLMMILLAGYAANATGIKIEDFGMAARLAQLAGEVAGVSEGGGHGAAEGGGSSHGEPAASHGSTTGEGGSHGDSPAAAAAEHGRRLLVNHVGPWIMKRAAAADEGGKVETELPAANQYLGSGFYFLNGYQDALRAAIAFFLVAKLVRLLLFLIYGALLPKFRKALWLNGLSLALIAAISIPLTFVTTPWLIILLWTSAIAVDVFSKYFIAMGLQSMHARQKLRGETSYIPAASIEHIMERMVLFTILIIGEAILVANYVAEDKSFGLSLEFGRSALAITLAFLICWLFFDADAARVFVHALRRNWFTSISFTTIHLPLCASLILMSAAMHKLVAYDKAERGYLWYFSGSLSLTVLCIAGIGMLHHSLDRYKSALMPHYVRVFWRILAAALIGCMPLIKKEWKSLPFLAAHVGVLAWLVCFETIGKIGAVGKRYDEAKANELKVARAALHVGERSTSGSGDSFGMGPVAEKGGFPGPATSSPNLLIPGTDQGESRRDKLFFRMRRINKDWAVRAPRRASWHEFEDLTGAERGEEDVGIESELGKLQVKEVSSGQRWAYAV